jgi:hypothetical protein
MYESLESLQTTFIFLASSSSCRLSSLTFANQSATSCFKIAFVSSFVLSHDGSLGSSFFFVGCFSLVVALTCKIVLETSMACALRPIVAEVNWEGCHHCDHWISLLPDCMVLAEKVSEQVVMTTSEMMVEALGDLSEVHRSHGL